MAREAGFRRGSSYQHYEDSRLSRRKYLPLDVAERFADALHGRGDPPIARAKVYALAGVGDAKVAARASGSFNETVLHHVIVITESYLQDRGLKLEAEKKAQLFIHVYCAIRQPPGCCRRDPSRSRKTGSFGGY
ncbi:MAG: hypothetical protein EXQ91_05730 [Alphaproteobacteria bacterium]|nr:hypothetical protein [Alphaproteobacteria bacterium]